jgi:AAA15 family ATPase/GTPase
MRIKNIYVNNFKSLVDFKIDLVDFNCLVGLNGSGKSTFLQFVSFLSQLMKGNLDRWLERREWKKKDILSSVNNGKPPFLSFKITFLNDDNTECTWQSNYNIQSCQCLAEKFSVGDYEFYTYRIKDKNQRYYCVINLKSEKKEHEYFINFQYTGSVLSLLKDMKVPQVFYDFRDYIRGIETVDLLAPQYLRRRSRESRGSIGLGGEYLSALLYELGKEKNKEIADRLKKIYPELIDIEVKQLRAGWKQLEVQERFQGTNGILFNSIKTESRHVNDGLLRMIGFLSQLKTDRSALLFDEIENGINIEVIEFLLEQLTGCGKQIIVTTHSPLFLNFLEDEVAKKAVQYFYKTPEGFTRSIPFFSIPRINKKLEVLGPGEAFADTDLVGLVKEIISVNNKESELCT